MKKALSLILAVMMLLGCVSITAFAVETNTWSFDSETMTFTVNSPIPTTATIGGEIPQLVNFEGSFDGINAFGAIWGKTVEQGEGYQYGSKWWNSAASTPKTTRYFEAGIQYGYVIALDYDPQTVKKDLANAKIVWNGKEYSNIGVTEPYNENQDFAGIFIIVDFGVLGDDGKFTGGDFDETESGNKSGDTTLTAIKAAPFTYEIVIPESVTGITAAGVYEVGQAKVEKVAGATDDTVISYTATTGDFKCEGKSDLPATYYTEKEATNAFPTDAVKVYEKKDYISDLPTMWVKIAGDAWNAAAAGTYTATVTFNFEAVEKAALPATMTIADILATAESAIPSTTTSAVVPDGAWKSGENSCFIETNDKLVFRSASEGMNTNIKIFDRGTANEAQLTEGNYVYTNDTKTCTFVMQNGKLTAITFSRSDNTSYDGTYTAPAAPVTIASILPDDFPSTSSSAWTNGHGILMYLSVGDLFIDGPQSTSIASNIVLTPTEGGNYTYTSENNDTWTFTMDGSKCNKITINGPNTMRNGDFTAG